MSKQGKTIRISGALCVQRGTRMLQAFAEAATVSEHQEIDIYDPDTGDGYQRAPVTARVRVQLTYRWLPEFVLAGPYDLRSTAEVPMSY